MQGLVILTTSWIVIRVVMFLPGLKEVGRSIGMNGRAALLFLLPLLATFLGSREAANLSGDMPGPLRVIRAIVYVIVFCHAFFFISTHHKVFKYSGKNIKFMLLYGVIAMASSIWSIGPFISFWKGFEVFSIVLSIMGISYYLETVEDVLKAINLVIYSILYIIITVLVGFILFPGDATVYSESGSMQVNGIVPLLNSSSVGSLGALLFTTSFIKFFIVTDVKYKNFGNNVIMAISILALYLGHSRTPIFASLIVIGVFLLISRRYILVAVSSCLGSVVIVFSSLSESVTSYMLRGQTTESFSNLTGRVHFWEKAWSGFIDSPFIGHGFYAAQRLIFGVSTVDNTYLEVLLGVGIFGFVIFVTPVFISLHHIFTTRPKQKVMSKQSIAWLQIMAFFLIIVIRSFTAPSFQVMHPLLVIYSTSLVCIYALKRISINERIS